MRPGVKSLRFTLVAALVLCVAGMRAEADPESRLPNFIIILADDLGYADLGCFGSRSVATPRIDRMAGEGIRFTDFHSNGAVCSPTRAALLTGRYQQRSGIEGVVTARNHRRVGMSPDEITFAEVLSPAGYRTGLFGKWHLGYAPRFNPVHQGFHEFVGFVSGNVDYHSHLDQEMYEDWWKQDSLESRPGYLTDLITEHGLAFIDAHQDQPFCLYLAHGAPHYPYQGREDPAFRIAGKPRSRESIPDFPRRYAEMIAVMDEGVGRILDSLRDRNLEKNTLVLFLSDNGPSRGAVAPMGSAGPLRGAKGSLWEGGHRVPAIAWWPGTVPPGVTTPEPAMGMDWLVTLAALARVDLPRGRPFDGVDLSPVLLQQQNLPPRALFWRTSSMRAVRRGPWKLVVDASGNHLFNLDQDLAERRDRASDHPERVAELLKALHDWEQEVSGGVTRISG